MPGLRPSRATGHWASNGRRRARERLPTTPLSRPLYLAEASMHGLVGELFRVSCQHKHLRSGTVVLFSDPEDALEANVSNRIPYLHQT